MRGAITRLLSLFSCQVQWVQEAQGPKAYIKNTGGLGLTTTLYYVGKTNSIRCFLITDQLISSCIFVIELETPTMLYISILTVAFLTYYSIQ